MSTWAQVSGRLGMSLIMKSGVPECSGSSSTACRINVGPNGRAPPCGAISLNSTSLRIPCGSLVLLTDDMGRPPCRHHGAMQGCCYYLSIRFVSSCSLIQFLIIPKYRSIDHLTDKSPFQHLTTRHKDKLSR